MSKLCDCEFSLIIISSGLATFKPKTLLHDSIWSVISAFNGETTNSIGRDGKHWDNSSGYVLTNSLQRVEQFGILRIYRVQ